MYNQLTREQRYAIYLGMQEGRTLTAIARQISVHKSTVSRELKRNINLIRQYIPKGTDFRNLTDEDIHAVQLKINCRPREKLNFSTPKDDEFFKLLL